MQVEFIGKFFDNHSLSIVNRKLALQLRNMCDLSIVALDKPDATYGVNVKEVDELLKLSTDAKTPDIQLRHSYPPIWRWPESRTTKVVYIQPWEFSSIPSEWQYKFDTFADAVITPSDWTANVYKNAGLNPDTVYSIPNGYDETVFNMSTRKNLSTNKIRFLYVGCSQFRKGIDVLLHVWAGVTKRYENVELVIKDTPQVYGRSNLLQDIVKLQHTTQCANIVYNDSSLSESEVAELYGSCDFVVHPYRGEGFGMHIQEAMACGCMPIVTAGGPTDEFATGYRIASTQRVINPYEIFALKTGDSMSNMGQHRWVLEPDRNSLANIIKTVIAQPKKPVDTSKLKTWSQVAELYEASLSQVAKTSIPRRVRL